MPDARASHPGDDAARRELCELTERYLQRDLTPEQLSTLNRLLATDAESRAAFVALCADAQVMRLALAQRDHERDLGERLARLFDEKRPAAPAPIRRIPSAVYGLAAAVVIAGVAVAIYVAVVLQPGGRTTDPDAADDGGAPVAMLLDSADGTTVIIDDRVAQVGDDFGRGVYSIDSGRAQFVLRNDATVTLTGRSRLVVSEPGAVTLEFGEAAFYCPPAASGFTVVTPAGLRVVDLGTEFELQVGESGDALVRVVDGTVQVFADDAPAGATGDAAHRLAAGEWVRWIDGQLVRGDRDLAAVAADRVINIDFGPGAPYAGPGVAATSASRWERVNAASAGPFRSARGGLTGVTLVASHRSQGQRPGQPIGLFDDYFFNFASQKEWTFRLDGLDDAQRYALVLYVATGLAQGSAFTAGDQTLRATGDRTSTLEPGVNYVRFDGLRPTGGRLEVTVHDIGDGAALCGGLQLIAQQPFAAP